MADISITPGSVLASAQAVKHTGVAGATITAGQVLYLDTSTNTLKLADANSATLGNAVGIALVGAASGQPIVYASEDPDFTPGGTLSLSVAADSGVYVLSATPGGLAPMDDLAATMYPVVMGVAFSTSKMVLKIVKQVSAALTA